ncbi:MAG: hypothetical protein KYX69_22620 [Sphingomonas sp.]|uniref:hypothetical protein n=1 Tax=Sphingomonas sp. TaxID=28214 RepID=UPI00260CCCEA|nr:hypothetical protein [Sphingomonas sp.]MDK2770500.1 hypothetical protein [Sphingomonas sp.]
MKLLFSIDKIDASSADVASWANDGRRAVAQQTRRMNGTNAAKRVGRHAALTADERAERKARRKAKAAMRQEILEMLEEAAKIRFARRKAREEEEKKGRRRRLVVTMEKPPKVTARGGRNLYRRKARFERAVLPHGSGSSKLASLVFRIKTRSLGGGELSRWRRREAARFARYLVRFPALEGSPGESIATNIVAADVDRESDEFTRQLTAFMIAAEDVEAAIDPTGQVYKSIIIPLPHEVGLEGRIRIRDSLVEPLRTRNMPFLAVLHSPDAEGDARNYHLHIQVLIREFSLNEPYSWAFAETKSRDVFHPAMLKAWRRLTVSIFNRELANAGAKRQFSLALAAMPGRHRGRAGTASDRELAIAKAAQRDSESAAAERTALFARQMVDLMRRLQALALDARRTRRRQILARRAALERTGATQRATIDRLRQSARLAALSHAVQAATIGISRTRTALNHIEAIGDRTRNDVANRIAQRIMRLLPVCAAVCRSRDRGEILFRRHRIEHLRNGTMRASQQVARISTNNMRLFRLNLDNRQSAIGEAAGGALRTIQSLRSLAADNLRLDLVERRNTASERVSQISTLRENSALISAKRRDAAASLKSFSVGPSSRPASPSVEPIVSGDRAGRSFTASIEVTGAHSGSPIAASPDPKPSVPAAQVQAHMPPLNQPGVKQSDQKVDEEKTMSGDAPQKSRSSCGEIVPTERDRPVAPKIEEPASDSDLDRAQAWLKNGKGIGR